MFLFCKKGTFFFIYLSESADSRQIVIAVFHRSYKEHCANCKKWWRNAIEFFKKFLESTTVQVLTITLCVFAIVALLLRLRLHQTMLSVVTTSYASIDETRAHIEGQIWLPDLRQRDVENYCAGFVYTDESKTTLDHISARYELQGGCVLRFLADYDRTIDLIIDDSNDLQFLNVIIVAFITGRIVAHGLISISHTSARMTFTMNLCCQCQLVLYLLMMRWECCFE